MTSVAFGSALFLMLLPAVAQTRTKTYCNPLPISAPPVEPRSSAGPGVRGLDHRSLADPTVIKHGQKWYLYATGGMAWVSGDLVNWEYHRSILSDVRRGITAPTVLEYKDRFYLTGNGTGLYVASDPLGPWDYLGDVKDDKGQRVSWVDPMLFVDRGKIYAYYGSGKEGIHVVELDPADLTRFRIPARNCFRFEPAHVWERWGDANEFDDMSWVEGAWITKHGGRYHLQYSAPGTEWKTYAVGLYTGGHPLGPFTYDPRSPILKDRGGLLNGSGHHSLVEGPDGELWAVYHVLYRNRDKFERRLALDPAGFDARGNLVILGPSETPQLGPGVKKRPWRGNDAGLIPLSINKNLTASSTAPGRAAVYALDNNVRTWWEAQEGDAQPWLNLDLGREFNIEAARILFSDAHLDRAHGMVRSPFKFRLEISTDAKVYETVWDRTGNQADCDIHYGDWTAARGRYARLTVTGGPTGAPAGVLEFTVFGK